MSSRDPIRYYTTGEIMYRERELEKAEARLKELNEAFDRNPHKAGSHEHNMQYRRWSDQHSKVKEMREILDHARKFVRDS